MHGCLFLFGAVEHLDTFGLYEGSTLSSVSFADFTSCGHSLFFDFSRTGANLGRFWKYPSAHQVISMQWMVQKSPLQSVAKEASKMSKNSLMESRISRRDNETLHLRVILLPPFLRTSQAKRKSTPMES